ncbi:hypothetical protein [Streptosporangium sandarakinum]|uniref:hypothetical protein n=1 Tax=Streptosporangium sandarakinum TaxID=1260955 RepID=UPI00372222E0
MNLRLHSKPGLTAMVTAALLALAGCGTSATSTVNAAASSSSPAQIDTSILRSTSFRFKPYDTPEALASADRIAVTAIGVVEGFEEGKTYQVETGNGATPYPRVNMVVKINKAFKGANRNDLVSNGRIYVELNRGPVSAADGVTPINSIESFEKKIPRGTQVAVFTYKTTPISSKFEEPATTANGKPKEVSTLTPHPQGLIFEAVSTDPSVSRTMEGGLTSLESMPKAWQEIRSMDELANRMAKVSD